MNRGPFDPRGVLALVLFGGIVFVALLWALGAGLTGGSANDGGGHAEGTGLNGYAALVRLLEAQGHQVVRSRARSRLDEPGLLVLTPPLDAEAARIEQVITERRYVGPTLLVLPKWQVLPASVVPGAEAPDGWVVLAGSDAPDWLGKLDELEGVTGTIGERKRWDGLSRSGALPAPKDGLALTTVPTPEDKWVAVLPLVTDDDGEVLAGYFNDSGAYPMLDEAARYEPVEDPDTDLFPVMIVAEPDLLNNYGLADRERAMLALELVRLARGSVPGAITFDLTLNGLARSANLLTLAFTPPFLAATLCLLLAALAAGWRAFNRFGPPRLASRAIAFGKRALVSNAAGLIRRSGRLRLVAAPFADAARERLARALGLPRHADAATTEAAIDRALAVRAPHAPPFSEAAAQLRAARRRPEMLRAAQALHALERTLTR